MKPENERQNNEAINQDLVKNKNLSLGKMKKLVKLEHKFEINCKERQDQETLLG